MRKFKFAKLVRDKIPAGMESSNQKALGVRKLSDAEFIKELAKKQIEEATELSLATTTEELKKELADVFEVMDYLKRTLRITDEELNALREQKTANNGGFDERTYIEAVEVADDDNGKWVQYFQENPDKYPEITD